MSNSTKLGCVAIAVYAIGAPVLAFFAGVLSQHIAWR